MHTSSSTSGATATDANVEGGRSVGPQLTQATLERGPTGFGIGLFGPGSDEPRNGVFISRSEHPNVAVGSRVFSINGTAMARATQQEAVDFVRTSSQMTLVLGANAGHAGGSSSSGSTSHSQVHSGGESANACSGGVTVARREPGRLAEEHMPEMCAQDNATQEAVVILQKPLGLKYRSRHVVDVTPGGNADRSGKIEVGMTIVAVNGQDCTALPHSKINDMLKLESGLEPTGTVRLRFSKVRLTTQSTLLFAGSCSGAALHHRSSLRCSRL